MLNIILLYRRITFIGRLTVTLWVGMLVTIATIIFTGALHFDPKVAFDFPPNAFLFSWGFLWGLGSAMHIGIYDYLGYYDVCYIGDEVKDPGRVIPRSIIISVISVAVIYFLVNLSIIGVVSWRDFVPNTEHATANFIVSIFMEHIYGSRVATFLTVLILWTTYSSVFALLLGYSRIPYAAALDGYFFRIFGALHPKKRFPYVSLIVIGAISIVACFLTLDVVINTLITVRILIQFIGQIGAVELLRRRAPDMPRPYKIWFYPVPSLIALVGWIFVFATSGGLTILFSLVALALGVIAFFAWSRVTRRWPFEEESTAA